MKINEDKIEYSMFGRVIVNKETGSTVGRDFLQGMVDDPDKRTPAWKNRIIPQLKEKGVIEEEG